MKIKHLKRCIAVLLVLILIMPSFKVFAAEPDTEIVGASHFVVLDENRWMTVGLAYWDVWKHADNTWQGGIRPGSTTNTLHNFNFPFKRNVKEVTVTKFTGEGSQIKIWDATRKKTKYAQVAGTLARVNSIDNVSKSALPSKNVTVTVEPNVTLNAEDPIDIKEDWQDANVEGWQYYVPFIIEVEFEPLEHEVRIQHFNSKTGLKLKEDDVKQVQHNQSVTAYAESFEGLNYQITKVSYDNAKSWAYEKDAQTITETITQPTIIRFYYAPPGSDPEGLIANLILTANPNAIKKDTTATVDFRLDASGSSGKNPIVNYEFSFGESQDALEALGSGAAKTTNTTRNNVAPRSKWYGKVIVTDSKGNTAEAYADITISELQDDAKAYARIQGVTPTRVDSDWLVNYDNYYNLADYVESIDKTSKGATVYLNIPEDKQPYLNAEGQIVGHGAVFEFDVDASPSWATNGIEQYIYDYQGINIGTETVTENTPYPHIDDIQIIDIFGMYSLLNSNNGSEELSVKVTVNDAVQTDIKATSDSFRVTFKAAPAKPTPPEVFLAIDKTEYIRQETAIFTPTFKENLMPITGKYWEIKSTTNTFEDAGEGEITNNYFLDVPTGHYQARQYITYKDGQNETASRYATVEFDVLPFFKPDVEIRTDKEKYLVPADVQFITTYTQNAKTYPIERKEWAIKAPNGSIIASGQGTCPTPRHFDLESTAGIYEASQTIFWTEYGEEFSKTATCQFRIISPVPVADFEVKMQMSKELANKAWQEVTTTEGKQGKQYKQIRIDLTTSVALNQALENPYPINFESPNTQISITPISADGTAQELDRNSLVHTYAAADKKLISNIITISGKQYVDIRFDDYGRYRIRARVANSGYVGAWIAKDIIIRQDLPPVVNIGFTDVQDDGKGGYKTYRQDDLHVRFDVNTTVAMKDEDVPDFNSAKLEIRYDYNADGDSSNDGAHSGMYVTKALDSVQPYVSLTKNSDMNSFGLNVFDGNKPVLGKLRFEYTIPKNPVIPYFVGGDLPVLTYPKGTTYTLPIEKKIVFVANKAGFDKVEIGQEGVLELYLVKYNNKHDEELANIINTHRGDKKTKVYLIDHTENGDGTKQLMN